MMNQKIYIITIGLFTILSSHATQLIQGDAKTPTGKTFSFPIKQNIMSVFGTLYTGADQELTESKDYAFARLIRGTTQFTPLCPEKVVLNNEADQENPLYGQKITNIGLLKPVNGFDYPVVVTAKNPAVLYLVQKIFDIKQINIASTTALKDADGLPSSGIISLITDYDSYVFSAVKPSLAEFGEPGSGVALAVKGSLDSTLIFGEVDAATGRLSARPHALALDKTSSLVTLNTAPLSQMAPVAHMCWDMALKRFFIGLDTTAGANVGDGALAIVVGSLNSNGGIKLSPIAPTSAFAPGGTTGIVGSYSPRQRIAIHHLSTMYTSTGLNYLIGVGGVVTNNFSSQTVFSLPLVSSGDNTGTIAQKNFTPINVFSEGDVQKLTARDIITPATTPDQMPQSTDFNTQVGGGILSAGTISKIIIRDDTVFAFVGNDASFEGASGIYSSQAIFSAAGNIVGWTQWQRAGGTTDQVFAGELNAFEGRFIFGTGENENAVDTFFQNTWSSGNPQGLLPVTLFFESLFSPANGGIQSMQTFLPNTPGLVDISMLVAGGVGTVACVQTGTQENNIMLPTPSSEFATTKQYENGTISESVRAKMFSISGGALNSVGPITASTICANAQFGWLLVGGSSGVAVLCHPDGSGWNRSMEELTNNFDGFSAGMSFVSLGEYSFVKKLICDEKYLYIITRDTIDRIDLTSINFVNNFMPTTIATKETLSLVTETGSILDALISQSFGLIATSGGLVRISDDSDIRTISQPNKNNWVPVIIPESGGAPTQLFGVSATGREEDITRFVGGHVYVLTSNEGYNQSRINRFAINPLASEQTVNSKTITAFDDLFVENIPSFFLNFGNYNSIFSTDGALYFASRSKHGAFPPRVVLTPGQPAPQVAARNMGERSTTVDINLNNGTEINAFEISQASGSWIAAGDFGIQVLE